MLRLTPILLAIAYAVGAYYFSVWRTHRELDQKSTTMKDPTLEALCLDMAACLDVPHIKVHIYEIDPVNGLAAPDGRIFITRGFFDKYRKGQVTAPEMASVIAHELGHVALGHSRRRVIDFSGQNALRVALSMVLSRIIPGIGVYIAAFLTSLLAAKISRSDEYAADEYASALLTKSGIGTQGQKSLFQKLDTLTGAGGRPLAWTASHPKTQERIAAIEANEEKWHGTG